MVIPLNGDTARRPLPGIESQTTLQTTDQAAKEPHTDGSFSQIGFNRGSLQILGAFSRDLQSWPASMSWSADRARLAPSEYPRRPMCAR